MKSAIQSAIRKAFAPYKVTISPLNVFESKQVLFAWSESEAMEWISCAFNSDSVFISHRYLANKVMAYRPNLSI
jgi:hypothetical protein